MDQQPSDVGAVKPVSDAHIGAVRQVAALIEHVGRGVAAEYQRLAEEAYRELVTRRLS